METFSLPVGWTAAASLVALLLLSILPTCLYLYVEPRGRLQWATPGDSAARRKAPAIVRLTSWLSFAVGQLAIPWLVVPAVCAALLYLQTKLGLARPTGLAFTAAVGVAALTQSVIAFRLLTLGVRLLSHDKRACAAVSGRARWNALVSAIVLGSGVSMGWAMNTLPGFNPWLRAALTWTALRPVVAYAAVCLVHALLLGRCARVLECSVKGGK
jgi:hypothetical protein